MSATGFRRYRPFPPVALPDRTWPNVVLDKAPAWCSVDLRDGNQALVNPMGTARKLEMFQLLLECGFKEIEVGFPAASDTDFNFVRTLIEQKLIPDDVTIQVLTQAREHLIKRTFEAIDGSKQCIIHLYNSTSELQRRVVFKSSQDEIKALAIQGAEMVKDLISSVPSTRIIHQYSPESFTGTEIDYAAAVCDAVCDVWQPTPENKVILNLPSTVELATPNVYADQIELFCRLCKHRDNAIISLHTHNDRGTGVAATELGLMAGADRVEGTLWGNGERTGNLDIVTVALNLFTQGIDPKLDFTDVKRVREVAERLTELPVHERHPYGGDLVFTAFSGSHQDAIKKGFDALKKAEEANSDHPFEVPYLTVDPADIGRKYDPVIRVNSQSGKGGVAFLLEDEAGYKLPRALQVEFSGVVQQQTDSTGKEITPAAIAELFEQTYTAPAAKLTYQSHSRIEDSADGSAFVFNVGFDGTKRIMGEGNGPLDAFVHAIDSQLGLAFDITEYDQHMLGTGSNAVAVAYVRLKGGNGDMSYGVAKATSITMAPLHALVAAVNRAIG